MPVDQAPTIEPVGKTKNSEFRHQFYLALVEHASRPIAMVLIAALIIPFAYFTRSFWFKLVEKTETVKIGSFEITLQEAASKANLSSELATLREFNDEQLQLFLIIGKERNPIEYYGEELTPRNLDKLKQVGLLSEYSQKPNDQWEWKVSEKGARLHKIISMLVNSSIRSSALTESKQ